MLKLSATFISMPIIVHEFVSHAVEPELMTPQLLDQRSCLYRVLLPPDSLNPQVSESASQQARVAALSIFKPGQSIDLCSHQHCIQQSYQSLQNKSKCG